MTIELAEVKTYKAKANGRINDASLVVDNVSNNVFDDVFPADRTSGDVDRFKLFSRFEDVDNGDAQDTLVFLGSPTTDDASAFLMVGTHTDTAASPAVSDRYGVGELDANASGGATTVDVLVKDGSIAQWRNGNKVVFLDHTESTELQLQKADIKTVVGSPSVAADVVTITLDTGLSQAMNASDYYVACALDFGLVSAGVSGSPTVGSAAGTFDEAQVTVPNIGSVYQTWTLTFSSATAFSLSGDDLGASGTGNISGTFSPTNPNTGSPYFSIDPSAWGGTFAAADTVSFLAVPCAVPFHVERDTPSAAAAASNQKIDLRIYVNA